MAFLKWYRAGTMEDSLADAVDKVLNLYWAGSDVLVPTQTPSADHSRVE